MILKWNFCFKTSCSSDLCSSFHWWNPYLEREWHIFSFQIIADILNHVSCMQCFKYFNYRIENNYCWKVTENWCWKFWKIVAQFGTIVAWFGDAGSMFWFIKNRGTILEKSWRDLWNQFDWWQLCTVYEIVNHGVIRANRSAIFSVSEHYLSFIWPIWWAISWNQRTNF